MNDSSIKVIEWKNFKLKVVHGLGVELAGWPAQVEMKPPSKLAADHARRIRDLFRAGKITWVKLTEQQCKEVAEEIEELREAGGVPRRQERSDKGMERGPRAKKTKKKGAAVDLAADAAPTQTETPAANVGAAAAASATTTPHAPDPAPPAGSAQPAVNAGAATAASSDPAILLAPGGNTHATSTSRGSHAPDYASLDPLALTSGTRPADNDGSAFYAPYPALPFPPGYPSGVQSAVSTDVFHTPGAVPPFFDAAFDFSEVDWDLLPPLEQGHRDGAEHYAANDPSSWVLNTVNQDEQCPDDSNYGANDNGAVSTHPAAAVHAAHLPGFNAPALLTNAGLGGGAFPPLNYLTVPNTAPAAAEMMSVFSVVNNTTGAPKPRMKKRKRAEAGEENVEHVEKRPKNAAALRAPHAPAQN